jgi:SAM-dependent methyltransferase
MHRAKRFLAPLFNSVRNLSFGLNYKPLQLIEINSLDAYQTYKKANLAEYEHRETIEKQLVGSEKGFYTSGLCYVCKKMVRFYTDYSYAFQDANGNQVPNWREHLVCPSCGLNNRMRGAIQVFEQLCQPQLSDAIYLTEQITPLFSWFSKNYRAVVGSEYLAEKIHFGQIDEGGLRNETLTNLSFSDDAFNSILSFDVFEHIPNYETAFSECLRCLKPGGRLIFTVPFARTSRTNIVRAQLSPTEEIEHILPPEYHGNPLSTSGSLCFYHFGWELLAQVCSLGFESAGAYLYWSRKMGYLGKEQILFMATK